LSYIDTSVIVAALDPLDPRQKQARSILEEEGEKVISELMLVELASIVTRREELVTSIANKLGLSKEEAIIAIILYLLKRFNLKYKKVHNGTRLPLLGEVYKPIAVAVQLSPKLKMRTLDLLHIAYVKLIKDKEEPIQKLVTADKDFEKARETLKKELDINLHII